MIHSFCCQADVKVESGGCYAGYSCLKCGRPCLTRFAVDMEMKDDHTRTIGDSQFPTDK